MTAEVAILNKSNIALAADSAVTIGSVTTGQQKVYNAANKLFMMSAKEPVGLMIYGNATFMRTPWEIVIKEYRKQLGIKSFDYLAEYADSFLYYLENTYIFTQRDQDFYFEMIVYGLFTSIREQIDKRVEDELSKKRSISDKSLTKIIKSEIDNFIELVNDAEGLDNTPKEEPKSLKRKYKTKIDELIEAVFQELPISANQKTRLHNLAAISISKKPSMGSLKSGVVIAGYGNKEVFPSLCRYQLSGIIGNNLRYFAEEPVRISHENSAAVIPLAQSEMVHAYMSGIEPNYRKNLQKMLEGMMSSLSGQLSKLVVSLMKKDNDKGISEAFEKICTDVLNKLWKNMEEHSIKKHIGPTIDAIEYLERDELAMLAESLVNLTSLKRKVSMDIESVGGPIDVALISKGDGFVWIKRKHYFEPDRNPHFMARYHREVTLYEGEENEK